MARVLLENVTKRYDGNVLAVDSCNLHIASGEFLVLLGPSGCGKTTTLRMVAGLEDITAGTLSIGERVVNEVPPKDRDIAMVFQNYALYPHMSVFDNMAFGLRLRKTPKGEISQRVEDAATILDIAHLLKRKPKALSGGQRQRVAMGRAIVRDPQVFLFDEPLSNLDAKLRVQMRVEISRLHQRLNRTILYVTHDQVEAMTLADRIAIMKDGVLQQTGTPIDVYDQPVNVFVAGFIGSPSMNFVDGTVARVGDALFVESDGVRLRLDPAMAAFLPDDPKVKAGFRAQNTTVADESEPDGWDAVVEFVEHMGSEKYVHVRAGEQRLVARTGGTFDVSVGDGMRLAVPPDRILIFGADEQNVRAS